MNSYVTGNMIKRLREDKKLTQTQLAEKIGVSGKAVSKWETGRGYPDITLVEPLASALGVSVIELFAGRDVINTNRSFHVARSKFYVCPLCGNIITATGDSVVSCCGIVLPALEADSPDDAHILTIERAEDDYYVTVSHDMSKAHYISFIAAVRDDTLEIKKLYPEGGAAARFRFGGVRAFYYYCNRHGLFTVPVR